MARMAAALALTMMFATGAADAAVVFSEGDFSTWTLGSYNVGGGTATAAREAAGGNPGARLNVTTVTSGVETAFGTGFKNDYATTVALAGTAFTLTLDVLSGAGAFGQGQAIQLIVEQGGNVYASPTLGVTNVQAAFATLSFAGSFNAASFTRVAGAGPVTPNLAGGVTTRFGFAAGNTGSGTLTQYYDNVRLDLAAVPAAVPTASDIPLLSPIGLVALALALGLAGVAGLRRR